MAYAARHCRHYTLSEYREVDFVVEWKRRLLPIEVKATPRPRSAEAEGLRAFREEYGAHARAGQLATTARSFLLYDARNAAIHEFLQGLLDAFRATLAQEGQVPVAIQPFEVSFEGQVVYLNRDRERSLAFRLYRDGVRGLTFHQGFDWEELARLLEVLSVRYTGVHQHEDDAEVAPGGAAVHAGRYVRTLRMSSAPTRRLDGGQG